MRIILLGLSFIVATVSFAAIEKGDHARFPQMMSYVTGAPTFKLEPTPKGNEHLIKAKQVFRPDQALWNGFFKAAVEDKLTNLRAFAIIAREIKARGVTVYGPGSDFERAVRENGIDLGLAIPAKNIGLGIWEPDSTVSDPEFLLHLSVIYTERFIHQFPDEVLPANLKIGYGDEVDYQLDGQKKRGFLLKADLYYGPNGIGFKNISGVGGQKRGVVGFFQKVFFFLPDAVNSMLIHEAKNTMVTEALIDTVVENFETRDVYQIRRRNEAQR